METIALVSGIIAAIVFVAERLAFAVMLYMLCSWAFTAFAPLIRRLHIRIMAFVGSIKWVREAVQMWWAMRALRRQLAMGATP